MSEKLEEVMGVSGDGTGAPRGSEAPTEETARSAFHQHETGWQEVTPPRRGNDDAASEADHRQDPQWRPWASWGWDSGQDWDWG
eukprot:5979058-Pyramimonas_sp.AAC.1